MTGTGGGTGGGGEDVCWLDRVCPECGRLAEEPVPARCPGCGAQPPGDG